MGQYLCHKNESLGKTLLYEVLPRLFLLKKRHIAADIKYLRENKGGNVQWYTRYAAAGHRRAKERNFIMLNVVALNGRLTADPELRNTNSNIPVAKITLAVDRSYVKAGSQRQADFIDVICWRGTGEFVCKYFKKGQLVAVEGSIQTRTYTDKDGNKRKAFEVVANNVHFAESRNSGTQGSNSNNGGQKQAPTNQPQQNQTPTVAAVDNGDFVEIGDDDDLPF